MEVALHDLCQPLTVLQCKLELGLMSGETGGDAGRRSWMDCRVQCG